MTQTQNPQIIGSAFGDSFTVQQISEQVDQMVAKGHPLTEAFGRVSIATYLTYGQVVAAYNDSK